MECRRPDGSAAQLLNDFGWGQQQPGFDLERLGDFLEPVEAHTLAACEEVVELGPGDAGEVSRQLERAQDSSGWTTDTASAVKTNAAVSQLSFLAVFSIRSDAASARST